MRVYTPSKLFPSYVTVEPSGDWMNRAGWTKPKLLCLGISLDGSSYEVPDLLIQKGSGRQNQNTVYHCKYPDATTFMSETSLAYWYEQIGMGWAAERYELSGPTPIHTDMYQSHPNGIENAYIVDFRQVTIDGYPCWAVATCSPGSGVGSSEWGVGWIYYTAYLPYQPYEPWGRYHGNVYTKAYYSDLAVPKVLGYDSGLAQIEVNKGWSLEWNHTGYMWEPEYDYHEYSQPDFGQNLFSEIERISNLPAAKGEWELNWLMQHAFYDACQGIGKMNDNSIQNAVEVCSGMACLTKSLGLFDDIAEDAIKKAAKDEAKKLRDLRHLERLERTKRSKIQNDIYNLLRKKDSIKNLKDRDLQKRVATVVSEDLATRQVDVYMLDKSAAAGKAVSSSSSAWLKYRYAYTTSRMDYNQFSRYWQVTCNRYFNFMKKSFTEKVYGSASYSVNGVLVKCTCSFRFRPKTFDGLTNWLKKAVHDTGFEVNPYVMWDSIPFSFAVDWFAPLGDVFDVMSNQKYYSNIYYDIHDVVFSVKYEMAGKGRHYYRFTANAPILDSSYWFDRGGQRPSGKLVAKRTLDGVSLLCQQIL